MSCPLDVAQNPFYQLKVSITWIMHKQANLLYNMREVWPGECQILKGSNNTSIVRRIRNRFAISCRQFTLGVNRCRDGVAIQHVGPFQEFISILLLREKQPMRCTMYIDTKKVM